MTHSLKPWMQFHSRAVYAWLHGNLCCSERVEWGTLGTDSLRHGPAKYSVTDDLLRHTDPMAQSFSLPLQKKIYGSRRRCYKQRFFLSLKYRSKWWKAYILHTVFNGVRLEWGDFPYPFLCRQLLSTVHILYFCKHRSFLLHQYSPDKYKNIHLKLALECCQCYTNVAKVYCWQRRQPWNGMVPLVKTGTPTRAEAQACSPRP